MDSPTVVRAFKNLTRRLWSTLCPLALLVGAAMPADADEVLYFTVMHTNDEHSALAPAPWVDHDPDGSDPTLGGFARVSTVVNEVRTEKAAAGEPVLLISAADILGGAPYAWLIPGGEAPELSVMQRMGYDIVTVGNHEFDYGPDVLARYYKAAGYPAANDTTTLVASNLRIPAGHPLGEVGLQETHIRTLDNGLKVGFFGLLGQYAAPLAQKAPIEATDATEAARRSVQALREAGAEVVIGVTHSGLIDDLDLAAAVPGIDLMVTGHCHTLLTEPAQVGDTLLVQAGGYLQHLGVVELAYDRAAGRLRSRNAETGRPYVVRIDDSIPEDPAVAAAVAAYTDKLNYLTYRLTGGAVRNVGQHVLHAPEPLVGRLPGQETVLGSFVTDAMRFAVERHTGQPVDIAIQANGVIRGSVPVGTLPSSEERIAFYDLASTVGLGHGGDGIPGFSLASIYLTGNDLYRMFELSLHLSAAYADVFYLQISGARIAYDPARTILFRVPFTRYALPTLRAVRRIELFDGAGPQPLSADAFRAIPRNDDTLYHVVCDAYILSFFPRIAELMPFYQVTPKDRDGNPIDIADAILSNGDGELKVWQAVVAHALEQPVSEDAIPSIAPHYFKTGSRIAHESATPMMLWAVPALAVVIVPGWLWRRRRRKPAMA